MKYTLDWHERFTFGGPRPTSGIFGICVHTTENDAGTPAENVANYQITSESGSYHVLVDSRGRTLLANTDGWIVWASGNVGNNWLIHISFVARAAWKREKWLEYPNMLRAGAKVAANRCKLYGIPPVKLTASQLRQKQKGFVGHLETGQAWGGTDHTDPGSGFPWDVFLNMVKEEMNRGDNTPPPPAAKPAPQPKGFTMSTEARLILDQLAGPEQEGGVPKFTGWPQLGGRTVVDALAAVGEALKVPGMFDPHNKEKR
ncbi:peptidoglycan recognition protein family protein [Corynebacterium aquilae]|uniref:N-acetylmuramoyl-L-alanine amidase domain-containing protein n=1 Tax=Corynebacterium aquilae DSM 44791 TaxID=1431546 RepID=A0A1L7CHH0_9CORY|nr:peptidoglycan recognition family protein [Corynebacterium aquilae]APT85311.1 hypothetical protein CAQU_09795 [Corynebacterium aquilae DSM 44791]